MNNDFGRRYRLLKADEYSSVFAFRRSKSNAFFQIYWRQSELAHPRIGLIVAKKTAKKAHERNYIKRTVREWFRLNKSNLKNFDYIVRSKQKFEPEQQKEAIHSLESLMLMTKGNSCRD